VCEVKIRVKILFIGGTAMAGTKAGAAKAVARIKAKDPDFFAKIGAKGGRNGTTGGFAANPELARIAGAKGGRISRRKKAVVTSVKQDDVTLAA
jgi:general stress protein YciG